MFVAIPVMQRLQSLLITGNPTKAISIDLKLLTARLKFEVVDRKFSLM